MTILFSRIPHCPNSCLPLVTQLIVQALGPAEMPNPKPGSASFEAESRAK